MLRLTVAISLMFVCLVAVGDVTAEEPVEQPITASDREHWSFRPIARPDAPAVSDWHWCRTSIDRFILAQLEERHLAPMPEADRLTLLRRLTYDLTGLPPTPDEINQFLADTQPGAYERVVDRLLSSPAYGERWAQHWLDLARFAETDGFEHDKVRPNAWRYRDWVVNALNADVGYDEFISLQVAGDQLRPGDPDAAIATGFLLCGPDMPDINLQEERRHNFLNDMTGTVASVFLGLQMQCASCHDHKYDPISQADFYRLRAFFDPTQVFGERGIPSAAEQQAVARFESERAKRWRQLESEIRDLSKDESEAARRVQLENELAELKRFEPPPVTMGRVISGSRKRSEPSRLWIRGDFRRPGPTLGPAFVRVVNLAEANVTPNEPEAGEVDPRTALARWLVSPDNPLTARVIVNRLWQHHFGRGLVASSSDFGVMGDWPTHPDLLDWLAAELMEQDWSLKALHRLMVTSSVYRTASRPAAKTARWDALLAADARNDFLGRRRRQRLDGESIRDGMLAAAGLLNRRPSGPGVRPPLASEVTGTLLKNQWPVTEQESDHVRRSLYLFVRRNLPFPLLAAFDRPDTNQSCPRRNRTTIAPQALHLLNSEFAHLCAQQLADRLRREAPEDLPGQVRLAYLLTLSRLPRSEEVQTLEQFLDGSEAALVDVCRALFNVNEFVYID